ncbi:MAG: hypothetical protein WCG52_02460 [bacterium]
MGLKLPGGLLAVGDALVRCRMGEVGALGDHALPVVEIAGEGIDVTVGRSRRVRRPRPTDWWSMRA